MDLGLDHLSFSILGYANGPGFQHQLTVDNETDETDWTAVRRNNGTNITVRESGQYEFYQAAAVPLKSETHGGEDVGIWAAGPMAHLFHGVHEQSYIAQVMSYSACIGPQANYARCNGARTTPAPSSSTTSNGSWSIMLVVVLVKCFQYFE